MGATNVRNALSTTNLTGSYKTWTLDWTGLDSGLDSKLWKIRVCTIIVMVLKLHGGRRREVGHHHALHHKLNGGSMPVTPHTRKLIARIVPGHLRSKLCSHNQDITNRAYHSNPCSHKQHTEHSPCKHSLSEQSASCGACLSFRC